MNQSLNNSICPSYTIGMIQKYLSICHKKFATVETFMEKCDNFRVQYGHYWLQVIGSLIKRPEFCSNSTRFQYKVYPEANESHLLADLSTGVIDFFPVRRPLNMEVDHLYSVTIPKAPTMYHYYAKAMDPSNSDEAASLLNASFLSAPFTEQVWMGLSVCLLTAFVLQHFLGKFGQSAVSKVMFEIKVVWPLMWIAMAYCNALKASVISPTVRGPFRSLNELADRLERREIQIFVDDITSPRYQMLTDANEASTTAALRLVKQIARTPDVLKIAPIDEACSAMKRSSNNIFLGYDEILLTESQCSRICFWKFLAKESAAHDMGGFWLKKHSALYATADLATFALPNYSEMYLKKKYHQGNCRFRGRSTPLISSSSLLYALYLLLGGWSLGCFSFLFEHCCRAKLKIMC